MLRMGKHIEVKCRYTQKINAGSFEFKIIDGRNQESLLPSDPLEDASGDAIVS